MALTDTALKALKPRERDYKVADEKGLYDQVTPAGGKMWKVKFRNQAGQEKKLSLGSYPEISLKDAGDLRDGPRKLVALGIDPAEQKHRDAHAAKVNAASTFEALAKAYIAKNVRDGLADATVRKREWFPAILKKRLGALPIGDTVAFEILKTVRPPETFFAVVNRPDTAGYRRSRREPRPADWRSMAAIRG